MEVNFTAGYGVWSDACCIWTGPARDADQREVLTLPPQLVLHSLHPSLLLNEVVDDLRRLAVLQLGLRDAAHVEEVLQLRVKVVQLRQEETKPFFMRKVHTAGIVSRVAPSDETLDFE